MTIRDLERLYDELVLRREDMLDIIDDPRSTDLEYNKAKSDIGRIEQELYDVQDELKYQEGLSSQVRGGTSYREPTRRESSLGSSAFSGRRGMSNAPVDELGSIRLKNQSSTTVREPVRTREPVTRESVSNRSPRANNSFQTKVRDTSSYEYSVSSLYPYVLSENVKVKEVIKGNFKERELQGISKDTSEIKVQEIEAVEGEAVDFIKLMSSDKSCNYLETCNVIYVTDIHNTEDAKSNIGDLLLNGDSLERKFGLPNKLTPIVNNHVCSILNDALVLNNSTVIIKDMSDFKELLETFTDTPTTVLNEIKNSINNISIIIENNEISVEAYNPMVYGFPILEEHLNNDEAMFISGDSSPKVFEALVTISKACESNVINLTTTEGSKYRIVISTIHKKAVIRKDNIS